MPQPTQSPLENLKGKPKDEKTVVAGGIAIFVVAILLIAWGFIFMKRIQSGSQQVQLSGGAQDQFNFTSVQDAQQQLQDQYQQAPTQDLQAIRDQVNAGSGGSVQQQTMTQAQSGQDINQFITPTQ